MSNKEIIKVRDNVDLVRLGDRNIFLVGTAHVSKQSAELVEETIGSVQPESVAVELCEPRYQSLKDPNRWKNTDIVQIIRTGKAYVLLVQLILAGYQKKLGDKLHIKPGAEMMKAVECAEKQGVTVVLADREVKITLKRCWNTIGVWTLLKLIVSVIQALIDTKKIDEKEIERLKSSDALEELMKEFSDKLPGLKNALISERDQYLAAKIQESPGKTVVAVVGAGHIPGIKEWLGKAIDTKPLEEIPPRKPLTRFISWVVPIAIVGMVIAGFFTSGASKSADMLMAWALITGFSAAIGTAVALAHPLSVLAGFIAAPITTIHPLLAAGWVTGLVEALLRRPRVSDLETIVDDITTIRGIWRNRVSHVLIIVAFTNLATTVGMFVAGSVIASLL